ncbi:YcaQ family DNA glycosylase [bacterium]|nr:YcaQ family DNA glycosylase [bacterium]
MATRVKKDKARRGSRPIKVSLEQARNAAVVAQLLSPAVPLPDDKESTARIIETLGYIQIDTISVVERAHHHTLWARQHSYEPDWLRELQARDRRIFEYWGHAASFLPFTDFRFYLPLMKEFPGKNAWFQRWHDQHAHLLEQILARIEQEGPLASKDFDAGEDKRRGPWWDWKPAKAALEILFWQGRLLISERRNFQRYYDLAERVIPASVDRREPGSDELGRFLVKRALQAHGLALEREILDHIPAASKKTIQVGLKALLDAGDVVMLELDGICEPYYTLAATLDQIESVQPDSTVVALLSPFDNLVIQRARVRKLFGFEYSLECYTPPAKRQFGYFSLPILWGNRLIGRLDPKADRTSRTLIVKMLAFEESFEEHRHFYPHFAKQLTAYARFNNCSNIVIEQTRHAKYINQLKSHIRKS